MMADQGRAGRDVGGRVVDRPSRRGRGRREGRAGAGPESAMTAHGTAPQRPLPELLRRVHMVGIGGAGMSGLARIPVGQGRPGVGIGRQNSRAILGLRTGAHVCRSGTIPLPSTSCQVVRLPSSPPMPPFPRPIRNSSRRVRAASRCCCGPVVLAELMAGFRTLLIAGTRQRRQRRRCRWWRSSIVGSTRRSRWAGSSTSPAPTRTTAPARCS